ncbi:hypothetical protein LTR37_016285 [Vermiconidia calcicola]|uniref:Uncharacterized protein n=1 Tax=Vermiconidia calcicola TaxID=1690605 RepID=A0ACC3MNY5_9PEZI|nr:hypothetical protein LTR37_016285 [Vermiconidia calcicola]
MHLTIAAIALATSSVLALPSIYNTLPTTSTFPDTPCPWTDEVPLSHDEVIANWYNLWAGDFSLLDKTVMPDIQLWQDRFPTGNGSAALPIGNSEQFLGFVKSSRVGFEVYKFIDDFHFGVGNMIALRWTLDATFAGSETATLEPGSHVAYNGTDICLLDPCSGRMSQVLSAQDLITYFHIVGTPISIV